MKKILIVLLMAAMAGFPVIAQEEVTEAPEESGQSSPQIPRTVKVFAGELTFYGMLVTGVRAQKETGGDRMPFGPLQGLSGGSDEWSVGAINPWWWENRAQIQFDYSLMDMYGVVVELQAIKWASLNDFGEPKIRHAFAYMQDPGRKFKISIGKLYDGNEFKNNLFGEVSIWKTEGSEGGQQFYFTDEDKLSARLELSPITGLTVGAQYFFVGDGANIKETEAWKEVGIGATYQHEKFNAHLGARFDSKADPMDGELSYLTYLSSYYGNTGVPGVGAGNMAEAMMGPRYQNRKYSYTLTDVSEMSNDAGYAQGENFGDGHYAFFGFSWKGIENLTLRANGGFFNLGDFNNFGYGKLIQTVKYDNIFEKLGVGLTLTEEFYGKDAFGTFNPDPNDVSYGMFTPYEIKNVPYIKIKPEVSYALVPAVFPGMSIPLLKVAVAAEYGICPGVLDTRIWVRPYAEFSLGLVSFIFMYDFEYEKFVDGLVGAPEEPKTVHTIGLAMRAFF
jgi:hypothetical protein